MLVMVNKILYFLAIGLATFTVASAVVFWYCMFSS